MQRKIKYLTREEVATLIETATTARDKALIATLFSTGCRISECLSIRKKDIATLLQNRDQTGELSIIGKGKRWRTVYFSPPTIDLINEYLLTLPQHERITGSLFPITPRRAQQIIPTIAQKANLPKISPHALRHSLATTFLKEGVSVFHVQRFLGHRHLSTTTQYLHVADSELRNIHTSINDKK
jgi:site-specific recombinase XerD